MADLLKIFVACHKPCDVPHDEVYVPIQVGRAVSDYSLDMIGDDTGDNISDKNNTYCEMTGQYWIWKNVSNVTYVGFCHYRRYFNYQFSPEKIEALFNDGTDVILVSPHYRLRTMQHTLLLYVCSDDVVILKSVIHNLYPEYESAFDDCLMDVSYHPNNMLICRKKLYDEYMSWVFGILSECEKYIKLSPYSRGKRVFGYLAEFLLNVYFKNNHYRIKTLDVLYKGDDGDIVPHPRWQDKIKSALIKRWVKSIQKRPYMYDRAHINSLRSDGIPINLD